MSLKVSVSHQSSPSDSMAGGLRHFDAAEGAHGHWTARGTKLILFGHSGDSELQCARAAHPRASPGSSSDRRRRCSMRAASRSPCIS